MTDYLSKIINDEKMLEAFISHGIIAPHNLVSEVTKSANGFLICKTAKVITNLKDETQLNESTKKELIKKLQDSILETNAEFMIAFLYDTKYADIELIVYNLIIKDSYSSMDRVISFIYSAFEEKTSFPQSTKIKKHNLLENIFKYLIDKKAYQKIIETMTSTSTNTEEILDILISINNLEFLTYLVNYLEIQESQTTNLTTKDHIKNLIKKINLKYRVLYLDNLDLDSKFKILMDLYAKGDIQTIAHYKDEFAPLFTGEREEEPLTR